MLQKLHLQKTPSFSNTLNVKTTTVTQPQKTIPLKVVSGYVPTQVEITNFKFSL